MLSGVVRGRNEIIPTDVNCAYSSIAALYKN